MICICGVTFEPRRNGGEPQNYCCRRCKNKNSNDKNNRANYVANRDAMVEYARKYRITHRAEIAVRRAAERRANPEKERACNAANYAKHRAARRAQNAIYHSENYAKIAPRAAANQRRWRSAHPSKGSAYMNARRVLKSGNGGSHTLIEWQEKCKEFHNCCAYCGEQKPLTRDHCIPLFRGGTDDISNMLPACRRCNSKKRIKTAEEFFALMPTNDATTALIRIA